MNAIYNDPILIELKELIENKFLSEDDLAKGSVEMKRKIFEMVNNQNLFLESYRYVSHLQNELILAKKIRIKKKIWAYLMLEKCLILSSMIFCLF